MTADAPTKRPVVTRFPPSPTGALHVGHARTALFAWAYARQHKGTFIFRFEDTDQKRSSPDSAVSMLRDLAWLGLMWDEGPKGPCMKTACDCGNGPDDNLDPYTRQVGDNGPYFSTQRHEQGLYDHYIDLLIEAGEAYEDDGAVRFKMGAHRGDIGFDDEVYGHIEVKAEDLEDFVIRKGADGGGLPTFHFAVVCDDALMGVTHVIRGQEHISNTAKHAAIYDTLAKLTNDPVTWARPVWVHTPSIMNPGGSKMSKRDKAKTARKHAKDNRLTSAPGIDDERFTAFLNGDNDDNDIAVSIAKDQGLALPEIEVNDFRKSGYLQSALLNYVALLGWNPGNNQERFDLDFLTKNFALERVNKANSIFDRDKLRSFNGDTIRELPADDFACLLADYVKAYRPEWEQHGIFNGDDWLAFCTAVQERAETLPQPLDANAYLIAEDDAIDYDFSPKPVRKAMLNSDGAGVKLLEEVRAAFDALPEAGFGDAAHEAISGLAEAGGINMGKYAQPVRIAVSGGPVTPPIDVVLDLLGKSSVLTRIDRCLAQAKEVLASTK